MSVQKMCHAFRSVLFCTQLNAQTQRQPNSYPVYHLVNKQVDMMDGPEHAAAYDLNPDFMERMRAEALAAAGVKA